MNLTNQQSGFAHDCLTMNQSDAYRANYDTSGMTDKQIWEEASKLAANPKVAQRIAELRQELANKKNWDTETWLKEAEKNLNLSREYKQMGPAVSQLTTIGKATGVLKEQVSGTDTALAAILEIAGAMTEQALRAQALNPVVEGKSRDL